MWKQEHLELENDESSWEGQPRVESFGSSGDVRLISPRRKCRTPIYLAGKSKKAVVPQIVTYRMYSVDDDKNVRQTTYTTYTFYDEEVAEKPSKNKFNFVKPKPRANQSMPLETYKHYHIEYLENGEKLITIYKMYGL